MNKSNIYVAVLRTTVLFLLTLSGHVYAGITGSEVNASATGYGLQPRPDNITVCFVGDALSSRLDRVQEISTILRSYFESAGNIHFSGFDTAQNSFPTCGAPQTRTCGSNPCNWYPEDIRIAIDGTKDGGNPIPRQIPTSETNCVDKGQPSSWGVSPWNVDKTGYRACQYNVFIGDDKDTSVSPPVFWVNHVLHEVGHALGLIHEFAQAGYYNYRGPNGNICSNSTSQPAASTNPGAFVSLTPVDPASVMMYQVLDCGIHGNYANNGLSSLDRLSFHILYPEKENVSEYFGTTVVRTTEKVTLHFYLAYWGANMSQAITNLHWDIGGVKSSNTIFEAQWTSAGVRKGKLEYKDFVGRTFSTVIEIRVLTPSNFNKLMGAAVSASAILM